MGREATLARLDRPSDIFHVNPFVLHGLVAAPFTPFHPDQSLNLPQIDRLAAHLVAGGVSGAFVCGTTGEGTSLTDAERRAVVERWVAAAAGQLQVIVHVGHLSLATSRELAVHAQAAGADAIATCGPFFYPIRHVRQLVDFGAETAGAAPRLPFYYYHIPQLTHLGGLSMVDFLREAAPRIPTLRGLKFTHDDLEEYAGVLAFQNGRFDVPFGRDEILLSALTLGARGAIGSTFNFSASLYHHLFAAHVRGDEVAARKLQDRATRLIMLLRQHGGLVAMKEAMRLIGLDCGPARQPLRTLSTGERESLLLDLVEWGLPFAAAA